MKKKCILLLVIAVVLVATGLVGCKDAPTPKEEISLVMSESALTLERFAQKTLSVQVSGSTDPVTWTTENEAVIALRPDGNQVEITGVAEGETTVSASLGEKTVSIPVYVNANVGIPLVETADKEITLRGGDEYTLVAAVTYQGENVTGADITFTSDAPTVLTAENGVLRGLAAGNATVTVSASYCGYTLTPVTVAVTVIENATFSLDIAELTLYTSDPNADGTYSVSEQLTAMATKNNAPITAEGVVWNSDMTDVAAVTDGLVTAVGKGTAVITATWNSGANVYTAACEVTVERPVVRATSKPIDYDLSLNTAAELDVGAVGYFSDRAAIEAYAESGDKIGTFADNILSFNPSALPVGEQYITVTNGLLDYEMPVVVATMIVSDKAEFMKIKTEYFTGLRDDPPPPAKNRDGYFILDADIDLGGDTFAMYGLGGDTLGRIDKHGWFGTLDGRGHIVSRVVFGKNGFTDVMGWDTVIKNVGFVDCSFSDGVGSGLFGEFSYGDIDNCFFQFNNLKGTGALGKALNNVSFTNSVVYISDFEPISGLRQNAIADSVGKDSVLNNLFAVTRANVPFISSVGLASGVSGKYESFAALRGSVGSLDAFHDAYWLKTDGTLIFKAYNDYLREQFVDSAQTVAPSYFEGEQAEIDIADADFAVSDTQYLDEMLLQSGIIKPTGVPKGTTETVTLTVTSRLNPAVTVQKTLSLRNIETVALDPVDVDLDAAEGDGIALSVGDGVADEIAWNGRALTIGNGSVTVEAGKITLPVSFMEDNLGENDLVVLTSSARYTVKVTVATLIIDDDSDFKRIKSEFYKGDYDSTAANYRDGYFVLANNIDMKGAAFTMLDGVQLKKPTTGENTDVNNQACIDTYGWSGVLDGRGYAVHNFTTGVAGMFGFLATDALIQNTAFVCNAITGNHGGVLANFMKGRIDNCFVEVTAMPNFSVIGLFGKYLHTTGRISNSLGSILTEDTTGQNQHSAIVQMINGAQTMLDNVYTVRPGSLQAVGGTVSGSYGAYGSMAELLASGANFDGFSDDCWNVSDTAVTWRSIGRLTEQEIDSSLYNDTDNLFTYTFTVNSDGEQVLSVSFDGVTSACASSVNGRTATLKFTQSQLRAHVGERTLTVVTDKAFYTGRMTIATLFIDSVDDMKAMADYMQKKENMRANRDGYFIMTDDVDMKDEVGFTINDVGTNGNNAANSWCGTFDGRGHLLKNLTVNHSGIFGHIGTYGIVKNLGIVNAAIQPRNNTPGASVAGLFGVAVQGTIDNCFAELTAMPDATEAGVFGRYIRDTGVVTNSIAVIRSEENAGKFNSGVIAGYTHDNKNVKVVNVYAVCPEGIPAVGSPGANAVKTYGTFRTVADMLTAIKNKTGIEGDASKASLNGFDARYWTVDETAQTVSFGVKTKYPVSNPAAI